MSGRPNYAPFIKRFNTIAGHRHRQEVFRDFVTLSAIALHNAIRRSERLEAEYLDIVARYEPEIVREQFPKLLGELVELLEPEPADILGQLYMQLEISNERTGQFFTPPELSFFMAKLQVGDELNEKIARQGFVTVSEPACGAGGMVLAFAKSVIEQTHNPAHVMWASCQDIDRTAALMCYIQLALWNIPGEVIVGNTLAGERREVFYTPAHWLGMWNVKLRRRHEAGEGASSTGEPGPAATANATDNAENDQDAELLTVAGETASPINVLDAAIAISAPKSAPASLKPALSAVPTHQKPSAPVVRPGSSAAPPQLGFDFDL